MEITKLLFKISWLLIKRMPYIPRAFIRGCRKADAAVENAYDNYKVIGILLVMAAALILAYCVDVIKAG